MHVVRYNDANVDLATATPLRDTLAGDSSVARSLLARSLLFLGSSALLDIEERNGRERLQRRRASHGKRATDLCFNKEALRKRCMATQVRREDGSRLHRKILLLRVYVVAGHLM